MSTDRRLRSLGPLACLVLLGVPAAAFAAPAAPAALPAVSVRLLQANIGNINIAPGACNDQAVKLCLAPVEQRLAARLAELDPEVVLLQEALPGSLCQPATQPGGFGTPASSLSLLNPQHLCSPAQRATQAAPDQVDRLLPPARWDSRCNAARIDPAAPERVIPPWDCVAVRRDRGRIASFQTLPGTVPGVVEGQTCDNGFTISLARLDLEGTPLQVTSAHPDSGANRAGCRAEKLARMFAALGGLRPTLPTVVSGDMNLDPYRTSDASTQVWDRHVSLAGTTPYRYRSGIAEADPAPFSSNICGTSQEDPTGLLLDVATVPAPPCASTLDHVATTPDVTGPCDTLGEAPGDSARLDGGGGMDHRGIACVLSIPARGSAAAARTVARPGVPAAAEPPAAAPAQLPATGGGLGAGSAGALLVTAGAVALLRLRSATPAWPGREPGTTGS